MAKTNKRRSSSKASAFQTAREIAQANDEQSLDAEQREVNRQIKKLEFTVYANGMKLQRQPSSREQVERKKALLLAIEVGFMCLLILAVVGLLNQWFHFLW